MPVTSMNEDDLSPTRKSKVGLSRQILAMKAKAVAQGVDQSPDRHLGPRVPALDGSHVAPALFG